VITYELNDLTYKIDYVLSVIRLPVLREYRSNFMTDARLQLHIRVNYKLDTPRSTYSQIHTVQTSLLIIR